MGNGVYDEFASVSNQVSNRLFSIVEDDFITRRTASVWKLSRRHQDFERKFLQPRDHSCTSDGKFKGR